MIKTIFCLFIYILSFGVSNAYYFFIPDDPIYLTRMHCQLMLHTTNDKRHITGYLLNYMINPDPAKPAWIMESQLNELWARAGTAPNMDFVIGYKWNSMILSDRRRLNRAIVMYIDRYYKFYNDMTYFNGCKMEVVKEKKTEEKIELVLSTKLINRENKPITLSYIVEKIPPYTWQIKDIKINDTLIGENLREKINKLIIGQGVDGAIKYLKNNDFSINANNNH